MHEPIPLCATYRLQLTPSFGFDDAAHLVPYLADLGVSHLYLSPILEAVRGSTHGYDVVDHAQVRAELGGRVAFERLATSAHSASLGVIVDIVPNHMSIAESRNRWWWDVLENGPSARAARAFDVDWDPPVHSLKDVVLVPVLADPFSKVLERGEIEVQRRGADFVVRYREQVLPVAPRTIGSLLSAAHALLPAESARLGFLADAFAELPMPSVRDRTSSERRHRDRTVLHDLLDEHLAREPAQVAALDLALAALNADPDALDAFLEGQNHRLAYWRGADHRLDYRRFFDITSLVGLRVEDPEVFEATHALLLELVQQGTIDGLRIDHVDGLADPARYLATLRERVGGAAIFVEKVLAPDEALPPWPVQGTTGYERIDQLMRLYAEPAGRAALRAVAGPDAARPFSEIAAEARLQVLHDSLGADLERLTACALVACEQHRDSRDFSAHELHQALRALLLAFPRYRSYAAPERGEISEADAAVIEAAVAAARLELPTLDSAVLGFLRDVLLLRRTGPRHAELVRRFQQLTPSAIAKGVEDTAFFRDARLLAFNEVGSSPDRPPLSIDDLHAINRDMLARWPASQFSTATHDTKRSEDVRARLVTITEDAAGFAALCDTFAAAVDRHRAGPVPDRTTAMMILQTLVGAWPIDEARLGVALRKVAREAQRDPSWIRPNLAHEQALEAHLVALLRDGDLIAAIAAYVARIEPAARAVSIAWTLLKITSPGVPDFFQGSERWCHALVDPDNRRPVDWRASARALEESRRERPAALAKDAIGVDKLRVIRAALRHRRAHPARFGPGSGYEPINVVGPGRNHVVAFSRGDARGETIVFALRWPLRWPSVAADTRVHLPSGPLRDLLSNGRALVGGEITVATLCGALPVALLERERAG
jgi:(1->4)-alpha-D-glucan 1-alpha-D-glucosylmutase